MGADKTREDEEVDFGATTFVGIPNYETHTVTRWIKEDAGSLAYWHNEARKVYMQTRVKGDPVVKLAELLELRHTTMIPVSVGVYGDLIKATLRRVNWRDVAIELLATL